MQVSLAKTSYDDNNVLVNTDLKHLDTNGCFQIACFRAVFIKQIVNLNDEYPPNTESTSRKLKLKMTFKAEENRLSYDE